MSRCVCWKGKRCTVHPTRAEFGLQYIADSPKPEYGGFNPETVKIAKAALRVIRKLRKQSVMLDECTGYRHRGSLEARARGQEL
jgi:hypothetical protein